MLCNKMVTPQHNKHQKTPEKTTFNVHSMEHLFCLMIKQLINVEPLARQRKAHTQL